MIDKETENKVIESFRERISFQGIKNNTKKYYVEQASFFAGAMMAFMLQGKQIPPIWSIYCMSDRSILDLYVV